jgi:subtilisin family serine protease
MEEKIGTALRMRLESAQDSDTIDVNIFLKDEPAQEVLAVMDWEKDAGDDRLQRVDQMQTTAAASQGKLRNYLQGLQQESLFLDDGVSVPQAVIKKSFWINNSLGAEVSTGVLRNILEREDVIHVELSRHVDFKELLDYSPGPIGNGATDAPPGPTWSVKRLRADLMWQLPDPLNGKGVVVAIVDSGVNYDHPDLKNHMWDGGPEYPNHGYDFMNNDDDPKDSDDSYGGHGTACAGIVAGDGTSGSITGVAPKATIMALRAGNTERSIWDALEFAVLKKAHVISMSMSWKFPSHPDYPGWRRTCESILAAGVLHANSIGNQGDQLSTFPIPFNIAAPGNCPPPELHPLQVIQGAKSSAISCGATDDTDTLASYSGRGPAAWETGPYTDYPYQNAIKMGLIKPDVCAPGPGTSSCSWQYPQVAGSKPYRTFGGTSAATPHVGGCLALLAQACLRSGNAIKPSLVQRALENKAVKVNGQVKDKENHYGAGRVDVFEAYQYGKSQGWWN